MAREIYGPGVLPVGHGLVDLVHVFNMDALDGTFTKVHACIYLAVNDGITRLAIGGTIVATGRPTGVTGLTQAWELSVKPDAWVKLCKEFPIIRN